MAGEAAAQAFARKSRPGVGVTVVVASRIRFVYRVEALTARVPFGQTVLQPREAMDGSAWRSHEIIATGATIFD